MRMNSDEAPSAGGERFGSSLDASILANQTLDNTSKANKKSSPLQAMINANIKSSGPRQMHQDRVDDEEDARRKFLDEQVEKIMAKKEARMNSEPARKTRKTGIASLEKGSAAGRTENRQPSL